MFVVVRVRHLMFGGVALAALLAWIQWAAPGEEGAGRFPIVPLVGAVVFLVAAVRSAAERPLTDDPVLGVRLAILAGMVLISVVMLGVGMWLSATAGSADSCTASDR